MPFSGMWGGPGTDWRFSLLLSPLGLRPRYCLHGGCLFIYFFNWGGDAKPEFSGEIVELAALAQGMWFLRRHTALRTAQSHQPRQLPGQRGPRACPSATGRAEVFDLSCFFVHSWWDTSGTEGNP